VNPDPEVWTVDEIAARWRVSRMTVYRLCHSGDLPALRIGRTFRITNTDLHAYEKAHRS
jgi:excisionase family DNA binding protein